MERPATSSAPEPLSQPTGLAGIVPATSARPGAVIDGGAGVFVNGGAGVFVDGGAGGAISVDVADVGTLELEATILAKATIGRPGPGVLPVAVDPRYILRVRVNRTEPEGASDFVIGGEVALGIHSPSRTFPGGVAKGQRLRLRLHFRRVDGGFPRYYHIEHVREAATP